ncbi:MAG: hypothetical protein FWF50_05595 [Defluviitaleaceae bacterium]|nr:hypothetical protein [Defluviitaleaceae bacterium]
MKLKKANQRLKLINKAVETLEKKLKFLIAEKANFSLNLPQGIEVENLSVKYKSLMGIELPIYNFIKPKRLPLGINAPEQAYIKREWLFKQHAQYAKYKTNEHCLEILNEELKKLQIKINALKISSKKVSVNIKIIENKLEEEGCEELIVKKIAIN